MKDRKSNFELMRIVSMFMILLCHFITHGRMILHSTGLTQVIYIFVLSILLVHVNSYVLLTGYFQSEKKAKITKAISLNNSIWFYNILILIASSILGVLTINSVNLIRVLSPITHNDYWFLTTYLILYLISPILNRVIDSLPKDKYKKMLLLLFVLVSILPIITNDTFYNLSNGYSLYTFIFLYFIGAYIKKYGSEFKTKKLLAIFFFMVILNTLFGYIGYNLFSSNKIVIELASISKQAYYSYNNPILIIQSVAYFYIFKNLNFKSKLVNIISPLALGSYLITNNDLITNSKLESFPLYDFLGFNKLSYDISYLFIALGLSAILFVLCTLIECGRQYLFKKIYNTKFSCNFRIKYQNYLKKHGIDIEY